MQSSVDLLTEFNALIDDFAEKRIVARNAFKKILMERYSLSANPKLIEGLLVPIEGGFNTPIRSIASVQLSGSKLIVTPWNRKNLKSLERTLHKNNIWDASIITSVESLYFSMPSLTTDQRESFGKKIKHEMDNFKISLLRERASLRKKIKGSIQEQTSDKFKLLDKLDDLSREFEKWLKEIYERHLSQIKNISD